MPTKRTRTNRTPVDRLHPNIRAWLTDTWPLPLPDEELELFLDMASPDMPERLWARNRPGEPFEERYIWLRRKKKEAR